MKCHQNTYNRRVENSFIHTPVKLSHRHREISDTKQGRLLEQLYMLETLTETPLKHLYKYDLVLFF